MIYGLNVHSGTEIPSDLPLTYVRTFASESIPEDIARFQDLDVIVCVVSGDLNYYQYLIDKYPWVTWWQVENEVYGGGQWWTGSKEDYGALLQAVYLLAPGKIIAAAVAFGAIDINNPPHTVAPILSFINYVLEDCQPYWNIFDFHSYWKFESLVDRYLWLKRRMKLFGVDNRPLWCTETGGPDSRAYGNADWMQNVIASDERFRQQALEVNARGVKAQQLGLSRLYWHRLGHGSNPIFNKMSLLDENGNPRDGYYQYQEWLEAV